MRNVNTPDPLTLFGEELPWVDHAEHLGHTLHKDCTMDMDARIKRAAYIDKTSDLRDLFKFANPEQILKAGQVYCNDAYGFMLYDLSSQASQAYLKSWNTFVKLAWDVPRDTYTYVVENCLAKTAVPLRKQICSRYVNFFKNLFSSSSKEVRHLANIVSRDARSVVFRNIEYIENISGVSPWRSTSKETLRKIENVPTPPNNEWRMKLLLKLLENRRKMSESFENTTRISEMINSLCNT